MAQQGKGGAGGGKGGQFRVQQTTKIKGKVNGDQAQGTVGGGQKAQGGGAQGCKGGNCAGKRGAAGS